ncbi:hypothetical protein SERLA73DRAFT_189054 [Serpula lacrymans var. lacrymans S7.3]|uniref:Caleosin-domain-containing protein n=2 Tax=Serpula lacrymans var. lacrymans TaxID=341189 RepID=F8QCR1_SERL3|nr:uncharacterized protein SERLADRAFT_479704 [Serpula lacrymans var. lacrymans S7.9]EGN93926.1 hypothetical protein SERLA73DRAFT_189054 [Serpula lacrymans var. lacrymans S7.3]EGO19299.1 hypothetical protein SERLADRAFT_479704 [Serpula lacrymans var. lacrymans S7.9]
MPQPEGPATTATFAPVTKQRGYRHDTDSSVPKPYVARAALAPTIDHPDGSPNYSKKYSEYSVMQQHVTFWDKDKDGVIWPIDTFFGFRELGFNLLFSILAVIVVHFGLSLPTHLAVSYLPDPFFRIYVKPIHKDKHGSDSGAFDTEGRFIPSRFEDAFSKYAAPSKDSPTFPSDSLSLREVFKLMRGQRCAMDPFGWTASTLEWGTSWLLLQKNGRIDKEDMRKVFDGSIFFEISDARKKGGWNKGWGIGGDGFLGSEKVLPFSL